MNDDSQMLDRLEAEIADLNRSAKQQRTELDDAREENRKLRSALEEIKADIEKALR